MEATAKTANQPQAATEMSESCPCLTIQHRIFTYFPEVMNIAEANPVNSQQEHCEHKKASRLRGGGAGKVWCSLLFLSLPGTRHFPLRLGVSADTPSYSLFRIVSWAFSAASYALVSGARIEAPLRH